MRGSIFAFQREIYFESNLERQHALIMLAYPGTVNLTDQPPKVRFILDDGKAFGHTFDYLWELRDGRRFLVFCKPSAIVQRRGLAAVVQSMRDHLDPGIADAILLLTERQVTKTAVFNAELINVARSRRCSELECVVVDYLSQKGCYITVDRIMTDLGSEHFRPAIVLLADGVLECCTAGRLGLSSELRIAAAV